MVTNSHQIPKLPKQLVISVWLICLLPFTLNLMGVDFSSNQTSLILENIFPTAKVNPVELTETLYQTLEGSFTHTILEWSAFCTAAFTVILAFIHFRIQKDVSTPILGVTLLCAGLMDLTFHVMWKRQFLRFPKPWFFVHYCH
ncbi:MAG: hypothetical protein AAF378_19690 [Cyanobacteria bacterium P01_A01_bin.84]